MIYYCLLVTIKEILKSYFLDELSDVKHLLQNVTIRGIGHGLGKHRPYLSTLLKSCCKKV